MALIRSLFRPHILCLWVCAPYMKMAESLPKDKVMADVTLFLRHETGRKIPFPLDLVVSFKKMILSLNGHGYRHLDVPLAHEPLYVGIL